MFRRAATATLATALAIVLTACVAGCEDDVRTTTTIEQTTQSEVYMVSPATERRTETYYYESPARGERTHESEPHMVSPGEMIVE